MPAESLRDERGAASVYHDYVSDNMNGGYIEYSITNPLMYYETGKRVLDYQQSRIDVLPCFKKEINGSVILSYKVSAYKSLREYSATVDYTALDSILFKLLQIFLKIKEIGFLKTGNIDLSPDRVFINIADGAVKVICLPLYNLRKYVSDEEERLAVRKLMLECSPRLTLEEKNNLLVQINGHFCVNENEGLLHEQENTQIETQNNNGGWIGKLFKKKHIEQEQSNLVKKQKQPKLSKVQKPSKAQKTIILRPLMGGDIIEISKSIFYIGSSIELQPDVVVPKEQKVSDMHCKIILEKKKCFILDCGSEFGTYVNDIRLDANMMTEFHLNDIITIGEIKYSVE